VGIRQRQNQHALPLTPATNENAPTRPHLPPNVRSLARLENPTHQERLERAFSSAAISDDLRRNKAETKAFGNLQVLKFAYKTNFLNASDEAAAHEPFHVLELD
jgi:hypothetical protein